MAVSIAVHGTLAFCAFHERDRDAEIAPFRRGRTTVSLRPTAVEPPSPEQLDEPEPLPPELEPVFDDAPTTRQFTSTPLATAPPELLRPTLLLDRPAPPRVDRPTEPTSELTASVPPPRKMRRETPAAQLDVEVQTLLSQANEGGKVDVEASVHTQPSPPFPAHLPRQPVRLRLEYTIDANGRFRDVRVETGRPESDADIARFIESRWRATPATRLGRSVAKTYWGYLNFN